MRPRSLAHRITAVLAAYALALAVFVTPWSTMAHPVGDVRCVTAAGALPLSDGPEGDHSGCTICGAGCAGGPASDRLTRPLEWMWPEPMPAFGIDQTVAVPLDRRGRVGLARAPPLPA